MPFFLFSESVFFALFCCTAIRAVFLSIGLRNKGRSTDHTSFLVLWLHNLCVQSFIRWKNCVLKVIAVKSILADELDAGTSFSVIQQQTVAVKAVGATPANQCIDFS